MEREVKKQTDLEKSIKETKARIGLWCHLRKRRRLWRSGLDSSDFNVGFFWM